MGGGTWGCGTTRHDTLTGLCCSVRGGGWGSLESHYFPKRRLEGAGSRVEQGADGLRFFQQVQWAQRMQEPQSNPPACHPPST